jgi:hypothetical protein
MRTKHLTSYSVNLRSPRVNKSSSNSSMLLKQVKNRSESETRHKKKLPPQLSLKQILSHKQLLLNKRFQSNLKQRKHLQKRLSFRLKIFSQQINSLASKSSRKKSLKNLKN